MLEGDKTSLLQIYEDVKKEMTMVDGNQERHFFCAFLWGNKAL